MLLKLKYSLVFTLILTDLNQLNLYIISPFPPFNHRSNCLWGKITAID
jgi:hypothetical protein